MPDVDSWRTKLPRCAKLRGFDLEDHLASPDAGIDLPRELLSDVVAHTFDDRLAGRVINTRAGVVQTIQRHGHTRLLIGTVDRRVAERQVRKNTPHKAKVVTITNIKLRRRNV